MISIEKIAKSNRTVSQIFKVPENYFENMRISITQEIDLQEKTNSIPNKATFSMPAGYFEKLSNNILNKIDSLGNNKITLESLEKVNIFNVPEGYFEKSQLNIGIERVGKENTFNVPNDYFETLNKQILSKTTLEAKIIKVNWWNKSAVKWSAAASVVLMFGLWFATPQFNKDKTELALENVSKEDIKTYLETQDLSYLEYQASTEATLNSEQKALDGLEINKQDILDHLATQDLDEKI